MTPGDKLPKLDDLLDLARLIRDFAQVERTIYLDPNKTIESDTDHTVALSVFACALAQKYEPKLDLGLIAQYALVHDLVEVYAGDVSTLHIDRVDFAAKEAAEAKALRKIKKRFGKAFPWLHQTIEDYESLKTAEARFVKAIDKAMPGLTHHLNDNLMVNEEFDSAEAFAASKRLQDQKMKQSYAKDQQLAMRLRRLILDPVIKKKRQHHQKRGTNSK